MGQTEIIEVKRQGEWYVVEGVHRGRKVSVDIHAERIDGKSHKEAEQHMKRSVEVVENATRGSEAP